MRAVLQRVTAAAVRVEGRVVAEMGQGLLILVGAARDDTEEDADRLAAKAAELRIFSDTSGRFNLSLLETGGEALVVSQFTLHADARRGRRPSFAAAAPPEVAAPLIERFARGLEEAGVRVGRGVFGAHMAVDIHNDGPVTIILDTDELERPRRRKAGAQE